MAYTSYESAHAARIGPREAIREIRRHGISAAIVRGEIVAEPNTENSETVARIGRDGCVKGGAILDWLGY